MFMVNVKILELYFFTVKGLVCVACLLLLTTIMVFSLISHQTAEEEKV